LEFTLILREKDSVTAELINEDSGLRARLDKDSIVLTMPYPVFYRFSEALANTAKFHANKIPIARKSIREVKGYKLRNKTMTA
jgi:hypothetical protein